MSIQIPQTSYNRYYDAAFAGQLGDSGPHRIEAKTNSETANVPAGIFVVEGATEGTFKLPALSTDKLAGVIANTFARNPGDQSVSLSGTDAIMPNGSANLMCEGAIWVVCEEAMAIGDDVYFRYSANGAGKLQLGAVRNDADSSHARKATGARVLISSSGAGVCLVYVSVAADRADV